MKSASISQLTHSDTLYLRDGPFLHFTGPDGCFLPFSLLLSLGAPLAGPWRFAKPVAQSLVTQK